MPQRRIRPPFAKRRSTIHGSGVFATRRIRSGRRLIAYLGEILTEAQVDARYDGPGADDPHTMLFHVEGDRYVDATVGGNDARFINHACKGNCWIEVVDKTIWVRAAKAIQPGEELTYDYNTEGDKIIPCRCRPGCKTKL